MRERERERAIKGWQACLLACILAIFACLAFASVPAFADDEQAELQDTYVEGGDNYDTATVLPFNTNNIVTLGDNSKTVYYKLVLNQDGYISFPDNFKYSSGSTVQRLYFRHSDVQHTLFWDTYNYYDRQLGLGKGTYYLVFNQGSSYYYGEKLTMKINFTPSDCWEKESNDSFEGANTLSDLSKTYWGSDAENDGSDYFKFYFSEDCDFELKMASESTSRVYLYNGNANHSKITDWYQSKNINGYVDDDSKQRLSKGWYYLLIRANDWYSFKINTTTTTTVSKVTMHRLYNKWTGEHFYTSSTNEKDGLVKKGWSYEGVGWTAPSTSSKPVYRLYNKYVSGGDHHYTMDEDEKNSLVKKGWNDEGIGWYSDPNEGVPLYRQYSPYAKTGTHNYTKDKEERNNLVNLGWRDEGVAWYGVK